jgi:hypothetical protein
VDEFLARFRDEFASFSEHILTAWFLRNCKSELLSSLPSHVGLIVSDFAENVVIPDKHDTGDQWFHWWEVALFGSVFSVSVPTGDGDSGEDREVQQISYLTSSDYRCACIHAWVPILLIFNTTLPY